MTDRLHELITKATITGLTTTTEKEKTDEVIIRQRVAERVMEPHRTLKRVDFENVLAGIEHYDKCSKLISCYTRSDKESEYTLFAEFDADLEYRAIKRDELGIEYPDTNTTRGFVVAPLILEPFETLPVS